MDARITLEWQLIDAAFRRDPGGIIDRKRAFADVHRPGKPQRAHSLMDATTTMFATGVTAYRLRTETSYFSLDTADNLHGYPPGIYATAFP